MHRRAPHLHRSRRLDGVTTEGTAPDATGPSAGLRWVAPAEAAVELGVSVDTVQRRVRCGALPRTRTAAGRVLVGLPGMPAAPHAPVDAPQAAPHVQGSDADHGALIERVAALAAERDWLRERVERAESEREQLRILLSNAQQWHLRALHAAPHAAPHGAAVPDLVPDPFPVPNPPSPNAEPSRWRRWWLAVMGAGLVLMVGASCQQPTRSTVSAPHLCRAAQFSLARVEQELAPQANPVLGGKLGQSLIDT